MEMPSTRYLTADHGRAFAAVAQLVSFAQFRRKARCPYDIFSCHFLKNLKVLQFKYIVPSRHLYYFLAKQYSYFLGK
jgi:hypothetical protein